MERVSKEFSDANSLFILFIEKVTNLIFMLMGLCGVPGLNNKLVCNFSLPEQEFSGAVMSC